jgi:hypothetical protein
VNFTGDRWNKAEVDEVVLGARLDMADRLGAVYAVGSPTFTVLGEELRDRVESEGRDLMRQLISVDLPSRNLLGLDNEENRRAKCPSLPDRIGRRLMRGLDYGKRG